jgi:hypothetical protein
LYLGQFAALTNFVCNGLDAAVVVRQYKKARVFSEKWTKMFFYGLRNERNMVKSRLSCIPMAEKVGDEFLLNDAENGAIADAPLAREIFCYCIRGKMQLYANR